MRLLLFGFEAVVASLEVADERRFTFAAAAFRRLATPLLRTCVETIPGQIRLFGAFNHRTLSPQSRLLFSITRSLAAI